MANEAIDSCTVIWAAGVAASPAAAWLGVDPGRGGRVPVGPDLTLTVAIEPLECDHEKKSFDLMEFLWEK